MKNIPNRISNPDISVQMCSLSPFPNVILLPILPKHPQMIVGKVVAIHLMTGLGSNARPDNYQMWKLAYTFLTSLSIK